MRGISFGSILLIGIVLIVAIFILQPRLQIGPLDNNKFQPTHTLTPSVKNPTKQATKPLVSVMPTEQPTISSNNDETLLIEINNKTYSLTPSTNAAPFCGDGFCQNSETCSTCVKDCGCKSTETCHENGVCYPKETCGDGICTKKETALENCCQDCGCDESLFCTSEGLCKAPLSIGIPKVNQLAEKYLNSTSQTGKFAGSYDTTYDGEVVKAAIIDCGSNVNPQTICQMAVLFDKYGNVVKVYNTN